MKIHRMEQRSEEWFQARAGVPTASHFHEIVTPTGKLSGQSRAYMASLLAERRLGPLTMYDSGGGFMGRGTSLEEDALRWYEYTRGVELDRVGLVTTGDGSIGCSPDALVADGGVEVKCLKPENHMLVLMGDRAHVQKHKPQVQGSMLVAECEWWDLLFFHPDLDPVVVRVERDDEYIAKLRTALGQFTQELRTCERELLGTIVT